jgi:hypothetical protein
MLGIVMVLAGSAAGKQEAVEEWVALYDGLGNAGDDVGDMVLDSFGNIYVTGHSWGDGTDFDYATIKYSSDSNEPVWVARYDGPGNGSDWAEAIAVDDLGNVYVTGTSVNGISSDYATIKYAPDSNVPVWIARYNGSGNGLDVAYDIAVDGAGNVYVTGQSDGNGTDADYATIKYAPDSNVPVWVARYNGPGNGPDWGWAIAVDDSCNVYVTGRGHGSGYATIKYAQDSNVPVWVARYNDSDWGWDIAVDDSCNVYVTGGTGADYCTIKYGPDSNVPLWTARYNHTNNTDAARALALDDAGNIYVTGYSYDSNTHFDYATIKYNPESNEPVWIARYNGPNNTGDVATDIALDKSGNIYVAGHISDPCMSVCTVKYSPDGNKLWVVNSSLPTRPESTVTIAVDNADNFYTTCPSPYLGSGDDYMTIKYSQYIPRLGASVIKNGSFEADGPIGDIDVKAPKYWCDVSLPEDKFYGYVDDDWGTQGPDSGNYRSLTIYSYEYGTFAVNDMATVSNQAYFEEDVNGLIFDVKLATGWDDPWDPAKRTAFVLIDGNTVWESNSVGSDVRGEYLDQSYTVEDQYKDANTHTLTLGLRADVSGTPFIEYYAQWDYIKFDKYCGGLGYLSGDFDLDCYVDMNDFKQLIDRWLMEGPGERYDLLPDGIIDFYDFSLFAEYWMANTYWENWGDNNCYEVELLRCDIDDSGEVDYGDMLVLVDSWLQTGGCVRADLNFDGIVDFKDFAVLTRDWQDRSWLYWVQ